LFRAILRKFEANLIAPNSIVVQGMPIEIEFLEPKIVVNKFSYALDIDIEGQEFNVNLPIGIALSVLDVQYTLVSVVKVLFKQAP
jgi:hypothetical protein